MLSIQWARIGVPGIRSESSQCDNRPNSGSEYSIRWAHKYYQRSDLDLVGVDFRMRPGRFWLVRLAAIGGMPTEIVYVVVVPDGSILEPTERERI